MGCAQLAYALIRSSGTVWVASGVFEELASSGGSTGGLIGL